MDDVTVVLMIVSMILSGLICMPIFLADLSFLDKPKRRK